MIEGALQENLDRLKADDSLQPPNKSVKVVKKPKLRTENTGGNHPVGRGPRNSKSNSKEKRNSTEKGGAPTSATSLKEGSLNHASTNPEEPMEGLLPGD